MTIPTFLAGASPKIYMFTSSSSSIGNMKFISFLMKTIKMRKNGNPGAATVSFNATRMAKHKNWIKVYATSVLKRTYNILWSICETFSTPFGLFE